MPDSPEIRDLALDDLMQIVAIHRAAFPESALTRLGDESVRRYYEWLIVGPHDAVNIGAFQNDALLGFCFGGKFRGAMGGFLERNRAYLARRVIVRPWLMLNPLFRERALFAIKRIAQPIVRRVRPQKRQPVRQKPPEGLRSFGILSIGVQPEYFGHGIAQHLMDYSERVALELGHNQMNLTVHPANSRAVRFYEKTGWTRIPSDASWSGAMSKTLPHTITADPSDSR
jgi:ribosomal protein S18 acetylase RimI-like enzyme